MQLTSFLSSLVATGDSFAPTALRLALGVMILPHGLQKTVGAFGGHGFKGTMGYLTGVVKASLTGSIIGNMLLVLGASALAGGVRFSHQNFNRTAARNSSTTLGLAGIALIIPTVFHVAARARPHGWSLKAEQQLSLAIAVVLILTYLLSRNRLSGTGVA